MRQAIEENFILDVLKNYTTFKRYFKLVKTIPTDNEYEKKKAIRLLTSDVDLTPHAIEQKTRIMLDHFLEKTVHAIQGKGRAMVVTRSRLHAVRFYLDLPQSDGRKEPALQGAGRLLRRSHRPGHRPRNTPRTA